MKPLLPYLVAAALLAPALLQAAAATKPPQAAPPVTPITPPKSVFVIDPKLGKDPFFPLSKRFEQLLPKTNDVYVPPQPQFPEELQCRGITLGARPLAMVNGRSVEAGERFPVRLGNGQVLQVLCLQVRERSVILEVNGVRKELHLRSHLK
ncbi:MAG: hypothetical protein RJA22_1113 [Verrucomicrobiota bacterium]